MQPQLGQRAQLRMRRSNNDQEVVPFGRGINLEETVMTSELRLATKLIALLLSGPLLVITGGYILLAALLTHKPLVLFLLPVFLVVFGVLSTLVEFRYRLVVAEDYIDQLYWRRVRIEFGSVTELEVHRRRLVLRADKQCISIPGGVMDRDKVFRLIVKRLKSNPGIVLKGDQEIIKSFCAL